MVYGLVHHCDIIHQRCGSLDQVSRGRKQFEARVVALLVRVCDVIVVVVVYCSRHDADVDRVSLLPHNDTRSQSRRPSITDRAFEEDATTATHKDQQLGYGG